jgi:hypothetical protein
MTATTTPRTLAQITEARATATDMLAKFIEARDASKALLAGLPEAQADLLVVQGQRNRMVLVKGTEGGRPIYRLGFISRQTINDGTLATWERDGIFVSESDANVVAASFSRALKVDTVVVRALHMAIHHDIAGQDEVIKITEDAIAKLDAEELPLLRAERAEMLGALQAVATSPSRGGLSVGELERVTKIVANAKREG